ncbi:MAG: amidohydrolase family protein [Sphingobacteriales bacterium]|nr:amidohydrolase family protein [Sphingobacteriales bacterium]
MHFRKFKANYIFSGYGLLPENQVLITDNEGVIIDLIEEKDAGENIEFLNGLLTPGFINAHCHLELSHLKGLIPPKTGLVNFVQQVMTKRSASEEQKQEAMIQAEQELYNSGTVAIGDICNTTDSLLIKQKSNIYWHNFIEVSGFTDAAAEKRMLDAKAIQNAFILNSTFKTTLSPHAPYSVSKTLFEQLNNETIGQLITIHNQETAAEDELYINKSGDFLELYKNFGIDSNGFHATGKSSLQSWLPYFNQQQQIITVHNTFIRQKDLDFAKSIITNQPFQLFFCLCINANKYIEEKIPPAELLWKNGNNIIIGTDSYASNWQLNLLEEIKTIQQETAIPLEEILKWATINGANALQINERFGSFEKGKKPGIVLINNLNDLHTTGASYAQRIL